MMKLKYIAAAFLIGTTAASAADLPARTYTKAPPLMAPAAINWTGFYAGVFGGYGWGGKFRNNDGDDVDDIEQASAADLKGGFGGGTIGYNWQAASSMLVWGLEADVAGSGIRMDFVDPDDGDTARYRINAFGSVTGRVGVAFDAALLYVKGGYAWTNNKLSGTDGVDSFSSTATHSGYTIGGGLEYMFMPAWSVKAEYMFADYGEGLYGPTPDGDYGRVGLTAHTVKAGINYHF
jgi:outer membrane immunogenic protein